MRRITIKKAICSLGIFLLVSLCLLYGGYRYTLNKYSRELDDFLHMLQDQKELDDFADLLDQIPAGEEVQEEPVQEKPGEDEIATATPPVSRPKPAPVEKDPDPPKVEQPPLEEPPPPEEKEEEPAQGHAIFGDMPLKDQMYVLSILNRFTVGELMNINQARQEGGDAWEKAKAQIRARVTEEEINKLRALYEKYM